MTLEQIDAKIEEAYLTGVKSVGFDDGKNVVYYSIDELLKLRQLLVANSVSGTTQGKSIIKVKFRRS